MKQRLFFLCLFILGGVLCHTSARATVYWDDDFESPLTGRWVYSQYACSGSPCPYLDISTDVAHSGTRSLRLLYDTAEGDDSHNVAIIRTVPQSSPTLFTRFYYLTRAFIYSSFVTNHFYHGDLGTGFVNVMGSRAAAIAVQTAQDCYFPQGFTPDCYANWYATPNRAMVDLNDDRWYCIETETTMNNPGSANAVFRLWVDGVLTLEYANFRLRGMLAIGSNGNSSLSGLNTIQIYKQAGYGKMYFDQFAVGTTRIGCGGAADTTPPDHPSGFIIR